METWQEDTRVIPFQLFCPLASLRLCELAVVNNRRFPKYDENLCKKEFKQVKVFFLLDFYFYF